MHTFAPHTILIKTEKGQQEISALCNRLSPRKRRILVVIDGNKDINALTSMFSAVDQLDEIKEIFGFLLHHGFIAIARKSAETFDHLAALHAPSLPQMTPVKILEITQKQNNNLTQDNQLIQEIKDFMINATRNHLGLLGSQLIQRIERSDNADQLMSTVAHWHLALQDSKKGATVAAAYFEQVKTSLLALHTQ